MKTASKTKKRAARTAAAPASRPVSRTTEVLLAAPWNSVGDDRDATIATLAAALPAAGIAAALWRPFEDRLSDARFLHLVGAAREFLPLVETAHAEGVKVVLTPELWRENDGGATGPGQLQKAAAWFHKTARGLFTRTPAWQRELFAAVDLLLPNSNAEARRIARRTKVPMTRMRIVPHGVDSRLAEADPTSFQRYLGEDRFVLYAGDIEPKNQQLGFLWAMKETDIPLVILGDVAAGGEWYLNECRRVGGSRARFIARKTLSDGLLASAWSACSCLVVGGGVPAGERIALKAGASGTPLVLFDGGCGSEYFGQQAFYVRPDDTADIRRGVLAALERGPSKSLAEHVCNYFSWTAVAKTMRAAYSHAARGATMFNPSAKQHASPSKS